MDIFIVVLLTLTGIVLFLIEIFFIPGITFTAIAGALFSLGSIYYAYSQIGITAGNITLISSVIVFGCLFYWLLKSNALEKMALKTNIDSTVADQEVLKIKEGDEGITLSRMNPIGKIQVNGIIVEGKTQGEFIDEKVMVVVLKSNINQIVVKIK